MRWLFDTNVVSESIRPRPNPKVMHWIASSAPDETAISIVSLAELRDGAATAGGGSTADGGVGGAVVTAGGVGIASVEAGGAASVTGGASGAS